MSLLKKLLVQLTGNGFAQRLLEKNVNVSQFMMGIGSGSGVESSGERVVLDLICQKCSSPYCIFDVGSNEGQYLSLLYRVLPINGLSVHCFEPSSWTFNLLKKNSPDENSIKLNNIALGKEKGKMTLYYNEPGSGLASLTKRRLEHFNIDFDKSETVKVDTLDNYCFENAIDRIHLLKLDVEGHELDVLSGASDMFHKEAIDIVAFEFGGCNIDTHSFFQDFYYFFRNIKMNISRITPSGYLYPIDSYKEIFEQFRTTNFVCMKNG